MTLRAKTLILLAAAVVLAAGTSFAAGLTPAKIWTLTIEVNVPGASIWVDNEPVNGTSTKVAGGAHNVKVKASGYYDFVGPVTVKGNTTFPVTLRPMLFPLTVKVNIADATVYVDGVDLTGPSAMLTPGEHTIQVIADGYKDYNTVIDVSAALTVEVVLQPAGILLTVNANVADATVIVNNSAKGVVPYSEYLPPGGYTVRVSADGFADYIASVNLDRPVTVSARLKPVPQPVQTPATLTLIIPPAFADPDARANDPAGQIKIYVDNKLVNANRALDGIQVSPGRHRIRVASGGLSVTVGDVTVQPGMKYVIEISLDAQIRAVRASQN